MTDGFEWDVCLSYSGVQRAWVADFARFLTDAGLRVFYDEYEQVRLWGTNLIESLQYVYRDASRHCVLFASREYAEGPWTSHERRSVLDRAIAARDDDYLLLTRFDDTVLPGVSASLVYRDLRTLTPASLARDYLDKIGANRSVSGFRDLHAVLRARAGLASSLSKAGRDAEALALRTSVLRDREELLGAEHLDTVRARSALATSLSKVGNNEEAMRLRELAVEQRSRILGPTHLDTLRSKIGLAQSYSKSGRDDEALELRQEVHGERSRQLPADHLDTLRAGAALASSLSRLGRDREALDIRESILAARIAKLGELHLDTLKSKAGLASTYSRLGRDDEACDLREEVAAERERRLGPSHPDTVRALSSLASSYSKLGRDDEALDLRQRVLELREAAPSAESDDEDEED